MKSILYFLAVFLVASSLFAGSSVAQTRNGASLKADVSEAATRMMPQDVILQSAIDDTLYSVRPTQTGGFRADNAAQHLTTEFRNGTTTVATEGDALELRLLGHGSPTATTTSGKRVERTYSGLQEWFVNNAAGLEQGFVVQEKPAEFAIRVAVEGGWTVSEDSGNLAFSKGTSRLGYTGLKAWDARGIQLNAQMQPAAGGFEIRVDDALAVYPVTVDPALTQQAILTNSSATTLGYAVALSADGNTALMGAPNTTVFGNRSQGAAFVFTRINGSWVNSGVLVAPVATGQSGAAGDEFGQSVALSADGATAVIGANNKLVGTTYPGAVFVFNLSGGTWSRTAFLTANVAFQGYGAFVAVSGDGKYVLAGAPTSADAYIYGPIGTSRFELQAHFHVGGFSGFGRSGALNANGSIGLIGQSGAFSVYTRSGTAWTLHQVVSPPANLLFQFGCSLGLNSSGTLAVVGSSDENGDQGAAYIYANQNGTWTEQTRLVDPTADISIGSGGSVNDYFGSAVAMSSNGAYVLVGETGKLGVLPSSGAAYLFTGSGSSWSVAQFIPDPAQNAAASPDEFGSAVALNADEGTALIGSVGGPGIPQGQGLVYAFYAPEITIISNPSGLPFTVTGTNCNAGSYGAPAILQWTPGAACTVTFITPVSGVPTTRYVFTTWENASTDPSRFIVAPSSNTTYTATFKTQYELTTAATPANVGNIIPVTGFYDAGSSVTVTAPARAGYTFLDFIGSLTGTANPQTLILNAPASVTAEYKRSIGPK